MEFSFEAQPRFFCELWKKFERDMIKGRGIKVLYTNSLWVNILATTFVNTWYNRWTLDSTIPYI